MKTKTLLMLAIYILPFILGAITHFFDVWIYIPSLIIGVLYWVGCCIEVVKAEKTK